MKINRQQLLNVLKLVQPALAAKEIIEQSTSFLFLQGSILTYNDEIAISHPFDLGLEGAVKAEELVKLLSKLKDEELELEVTENELLIRGKRSKAGIRLEAEISLPVADIKTPEKWVPLPKDFSEAVSFCLFSASREMSKPVLTCLHAKGDVVESCDNFRLTRYKLESHIQGKILLPATAAKVLCKYAPVEYGLLDGWAHCRNADQVSFSARVFEGDYPNLDPFLSLKDGEEITFPGDLGEMLERAGVFSIADFAQDEQVQITLEKRHMTIRGEGSVGWFEEKCPIRRSRHELLQFSTHPEFLQQMLKHVSRTTVGGAEGRLLIEGDKWSHMIVLAAKE